MKKMNSDPRASRAKAEPSHAATCSHAQAVADATRDTRLTRAAKAAATHHALTVPDPKRTKLGPRALKSVFVGYAENSKAYRLLDLKSNVIVEPRDVEFIEDKFKSDSDFSAPTISLEIDSNVGSSRENESVVPNNTTEPRRSQRARKEKILDPDFIDSQAIAFLVEGDRENILKEIPMHNNADKCIYSKFTDAYGVIICLYVDDLLIFGTNLEGIFETKEYLNSRFKMKDLNEVDTVLGIKTISRMAREKRARASTSRSRAAPKPEPITVEFDSNRYRNRKALDRFLQKNASLLAQGQRPGIYKHFPEAMVNGVGNHTRP
ncbi:hypothetical protein RJ639_028434 [Escallonia herrerae]|uniref:Reverse transcriptase Ty1/copia-type domain-containing protein n=1 Tax=Escallonia herrerae TaxID=1293975 RepID=A0AA89BE50_9ASTE|nr:hypothetical protein RJ639_028434 [Escallonia herrerae]